MEVGEAGIMIWTPYGGRMSRISPSETPFPHRKGILYSIQYYSKWQEKGNVAGPSIWAGLTSCTLHDSFCFQIPKSSYLNYRDLDIGINTIGTFAEAKCKRQGRPENYFKNEQSIVAPPDPS
ncbi:berberine bridge enzyme-like 13 [Quercus suber]|uniref:Berberine bridge enzyme-like 13 n=1 Tax=Quercus suber TaxID=58331 RepID=A0AAW0JG25_QUESU